MFIRLMTFVGGVSFCGLGYLVYTEGRFWSWNNQMYIDYTGMQKPMGIFMILVGIMCFFGSVWISSNREYICVECEHLAHFPFDKKRTYHCSQCGGSMEELEGFYERHPEKKDRQT